MRVAIFVSGVSADIGGGYTFEGDVLDGFLESRSASRHSFGVICPSSSAEFLSRRLRDTGLPVQPVFEGWIERLLRPLLNGVPLLRAHWRLPSALDVAADALSADLIWFLGAGAHRTDRPYMTVVWDVQHRVTPWFPELSAKGMWDIRELANARFLQRATRIVCGTAAGQAELDRHYRIPAERTVLLPHPTPGFALNASASVPLAAPLGLKNPYLLYPAQFWAHKNHANLLLALKILREQHGLMLDLALAGSDKGNRAHVEQTASELGLMDSVHFLGFVSRDDLISLYKSAFALAYVSWAGPENLPPLEAFALGCPVVATRIPGADEQLGNAAILVEPGDPSDIASGISGLKDDETRTRLIAAGLSRAQQWTSKNYVCGVFRIIDELEPIIRCWRQTPQDHVASR
jgi:glycosyltransferase involved in cell wall biosynthesis